MIRPRASVLPHHAFGWLLLLLAVAGAFPLAAQGAETPAGRAQAAQPLAPPKDVTQLQAIEAKVKQVVAKVLPCTVVIRVGPSQGSGVIVSEDGYVLTAGHVAGKPGQRAAFVLPDGKTVKGKTLGIHRRADAGLAKITDEGKWPFVEMGNSAKVQLGSWCVAVGHPLGYQEERPPAVRVGRAIQACDHAIQTDCPLVAGDSGGPLCDLDGKVIGINSRISGSSANNFHVPVDAFRESWDRLVKGEEWTEGVPGKDSRQVKAGFRQAVAEAGRCVVRVKCEGKDAALGTIVGPDGWILTKASELKGRIVCRGRDGREQDARVVGVDPQFDLAMLKVEATGLPSIEWSKGGQRPVGQWVATPGVADGPPLAVGVLSVPRRRIPPTSGVLGVAVADADGGAKVIKVLPDSAAAKAEIKVDDLITHVDGEPTEDHTKLIAAIKEHQPGEVVRLTVQRGDKKFEISAKLTKLDTPQTRKRDMQNRSPVGISDRSDNFPTVLQHDTVLRPVDCGGPLVDLSGKVIGVNVARGGRTETYAVPSDILLPLMYDLMSGRLPPPKPEPKEEPKAKPTPPAAEKPKPKQKPEAKPEPKPEAKPEPEEKPEVKPEPKPDVKPEPKEQPKPKPAPQAEQKPEPKEEPETKPEPKPDVKPEPIEKPKPARQAEEKPQPDEKEQPAEKPESGSKPEAEKE